MTYTEPDLENFIKTFYRTTQCKYCHKWTFDEHKKIFYTYNPTYCCFKSYESKHNDICTYICGLICGCIISTYSFICIYLS